MNAEFEEGAIAFRKCIADFRFPNLAGCTLDCAPTFDMLKTSEEPAEARFDNFGPGLGTPSPRPDSSLCIANSNQKYIEINEFFEKKLNTKIN